MVGLRKVSVLASQDPALKYCLNAVEKQRSLNGFQVLLYFLNSLDSLLSILVLDVEAY